VQPKRRLSLSLEPAVKLHKLPGQISGRPVVFAAASRHTTAAAIRRYGRLVAVYTVAGWKVRDSAGALTPASAGQAALYSELPEWTEP
jgi:hypothetical protein